MSQYSRLRPVIGITSDLRSRRSDKTTESELFIPRRYARAVASAGGLPIILAPVRGMRAIRQLIATIDGLLISGGDFDIHPKFYREKPSVRLGRIKPERTLFEWALGNEALAADLPVFGICGGAQLINVLRGGTLHQHLSNAYPTSAFHTAQARRQHPIQITPGTRLAAIVKKQRLIVNTTHHQAIKRLGNHLIISAKAPDGVIEAIESQAHSFVLGLQWHPEALAPKFSEQRTIIQAFIDTARKRPQTRSR